jgi:glycosyltransferase involved in cell wall biosynthesis
MRICMIGNATAVHLRRWASAYVAAGHDVDIVSIRSAEVPGAKVHTSSIGPVNTPNPVWTLLSYLRLALTVRPRVRSLDPDVVNPHFVTTSGAFARIAGVHPIVLTAWGSDVIPADGKRQGCFIRRLNRWARRGADHVTAASRYLARWAEQSGASEVEVVPFGIDTSRFYPADSNPHRPFTIGAVKALRAKYGTRTLIEAFAILRRWVPDARLIIAGGGPERPALESLARRLAVDTQVDFLGPVPHVDVAHLMQRIDVLVNSTVVPEAFGVVVLEASASGVPVVATDVGGVPEVCIDGETGILVPPNDPSALASALRALANDAELRSMMGRAGRAFVEREFDWAASVAAMLGVIAASREHT